MGTFEYRMREFISNGILLCQANEVLQMKDCELMIVEGAYVCKAEVCP